MFDPRPLVDIATAIGREAGALVQRMRASAVVSFDTKSTSHGRGDRRGPCLRTTRPDASVRVAPRRTGARRGGAAGPCCRRGSDLGGRPHRRHRQLPLRIPLVLGVDRSAARRRVRRGRRGGAGDRSRVDRRTRATAPSWTVRRCGCPRRPTCRCRCWDTGSPTGRSGVSGRPTGGRGCRLGCATCAGPVRRRWTSARWPQAGSTPTSSTALGRWDWAGRRTDRRGGRRGRAAARLVARAGRGRDVRRHPRYRRRAVRGAHRVRLRQSLKTPGQSANISVMQKTFADVRKRLLHKGLREGPNQR